MVTPEEAAEGLRSFIGTQTGAGDAVTVENVVRLSGGASRQTWAFDAKVPGREDIPGIFRADPVAGVGTSPGRALEYSLIKAAWDNGVVVPEPLWDGDDTFDVRFFTMKRVEGEALGARLIRGQQYGHAREVISDQLAQSLARIHRIDVPNKAPELLDLPGPEPGVSPAYTEVQNWEASYRRATPDPHPVFELAFRYLYSHMPQVDERVLVHGDYRVGNFIFGEDGLRGIIDWELAHFGDPMEDIGWLCVKSWRFGGDKPVGGFGDREQFYAAYEAAGGYPVDRDRVRFWELFGNLRWGVITITQTMNYINGVNKSVELAAIGRRTVETEWELLNLLEGA